MDSSKHGLIIDLNRYRPGKNLKQYLDAGVDGFILRIGGPAQWVEGDYRYQEDPTWRPYMEQAAKLGITNKIGGYIIHNPFEDWHLQGVVSNVHLNLLNQWTSGGYLPGYLILDHEINWCYRGATKIIVTVPNLVGSLGSVTSQIYKQWRRMVVVYSGRWFIDQNGPAEHAVYFDNINKPESAGGAGLQRPAWFAAYINPTKEFSNLKQAVSELPIPTASYTSRFLSCGSYTLASLWQFTDRLRITGDGTGVDASVTMGTIDEYWAAVGVKTTPQEPPTEPPDEPPASIEFQEQLNALKGRVQALEGIVEQLNQFRTNVKGA